MSGKSRENEQMKGAFETEADHMHDNLVHESDGFGGDDGLEGFTDKYFASCQDCPIPGGWIGPNRSTREEAQADANAHNDSHPGHRAGVA